MNASLRPSDDRCGSYQPSFVRWESDAHRFPDERKGNTKRVPKSRDSHRLSCKGFPHDQIVINIFKSKPDPKMDNHIG